MYGYVMVVKQHIQHFRYLGGRLDFIDMKNTKVSGENQRYAAN